jgi:hypothetical protein
MKYFVIAFVIQIILFVLAIAKLSASAQSPESARLSSGLVSFYWPAVSLVGLLLGESSGGESSMFAPLWFGVPLGIAIYSLVFGLICCYLSRAIKSRGRWEIKCR